MLSPVTDLALTGASWETRAAADPYFLRSQAAELVRSYLGGHDPADPLASPLYGELAGYRRSASMSAMMRCCSMTRSVMLSGLLRPGWMLALTCGKACRTDFCPALVRWPPPSRHLIRSAGFWPIA